MPVFKKGLFWLFAFVAIFLFSQDFWRWDDVVADSFLHIPSFIYYFILLQLILSCLLYLFSKHYWSKNEGATEEHVR